MQMVLWFSLIDHTTSSGVNGISNEGFISTAQESHRNKETPPGAHSMQTCQVME